LTSPSALAARYDCLLLDLDGVIYRGDELIPGADRVVDELRAIGVGLAFLTNNSSRTPEQVAGKLRDLGVQVAPGEIVTSAISTAELLGRRGGGTAFVVGEEGLTTALAGAGLEILDGNAAERADWVVVGLDRSADYQTFARACLMVERGARLVASNPDASFPVPEGLWPGAGALLAVVTETTGEAAEIVGKPHAPLFETALARAGGGQPLVVGDRIDTDIAGAAALGWDSVLVLSGVSSREDADRADPPATYVGKDLSIVLEEAEPRR
jgi:HAD superfamily hydrolase (TIGR01457 family)